MHKKARHKRSMANNDGHDNITINNKNPNEQIISPEVCNRASRSTGKSPKCFRKSTNL